MNEALQLTLEISFGVTFSTAVKNATQTNALKKMNFGDTLKVK